MKRKGYYTIIISDATKNPTIDIEIPITIDGERYNKMYLWEADYCLSMCTSETDFINRALKRDIVKNELLKSENSGFKPNVVNIKGTSQNKPIIYNDKIINDITHKIISKQYCYKIIADKIEKNIELSEKEAKFIKKFMVNGKLQSFKTNDALVDSGYAHNLTQELFNFVLANPANLQFINKCRASIGANYAYHLFDELTEYQTQYQYESRGGVPSEKGRSSKQIFVRCEENLRVYNNFREAHFLMKLVKQKDLAARKEARADEKQELEDILKYYNSLKSTDRNDSYDEDFSIPDEEYDNSGYNI